jgi:hypothetical protein
MAAVIGCVALASTASAPARADSVTAGALLAQIPVSAPVSAGYSRTLFGDWVDQGDGCDTRAVVLDRDSTVDVTTVDGPCTVATGQWLSPYDGQTWTAAADVEIDHMVPVGEAWSSGASRWTSQQRLAYANDLGYPYSLIPVTGTITDSKGDKDPTLWLPPLTTDQCDYAVDWVAVKWRWRLSIDPAELQTLTGLMNTAGCGTTAVTVDRAIDPQPAESSLPTGATLNPGGQLTSPGGAYFLAMQTDGNLVIYTAAMHALWSTGTYGHPGAFLVNQGDGNLVVYTSAWQPLWFSGHFTAAATTLNMQGDGNLVQYSPAGAIWNSGTYVAPPPPPITGNILTAGQIIHATQQLTSPDVKSFFVMEPDGNAVVYSNGVATWNSRTNGRGSILVMQSDGNAVIYTATNVAAFSTNTYGNPGALMVMQADGNLVIYTAAGVPAWSSRYSAPLALKWPLPPPPSGPPVSEYNITPGAFCAPAGAIGLSSQNKMYVCMATATDPQNRWR